MTSTAGVPPVSTDDTTAAKPRGRKLTGYWLILPGAVWLLLFFVIPFYSLVASSLFDPKGSVLTGYEMTWHVGNYVDAFNQYKGQLGRSLLYAGLATLTCLVVGYVLAYAIAFKAGRWKNLMLVLVIAPFFTSFLLRTLSWKLILADDGWVVGVAQAIHLTDVLNIIGLTTTDDRLLATPFAVIAGLTYNFLPFMVLPLYASLEKVDIRLIEAAGDLYASPMRGFFKVTFPLSLPGVVAGTLLTFIPAAGDYVNAQLLGSTNTKMIGNSIQSLFTTQGDYATAGALSVILMVIIVAAVMAYVRTAGTEELV
ncbi:ABC transporter permease [Aeromicrobium endophyticum]|uniref:ABC transporter permease n=1 Tax=Aeromicrobium endophyticum TaxID=2292704 RepID=A0A371P345_9ACTN|nr:ABC transporter permease [Aeromicrobium endophyticum]REK69786.1 ABC transporter permease [Aeromicrobium endophyticum]